MQTNAMAQPDDRAITFGSFSVYPKRHLLLKEGRPVPLGHRAFSILIALLEQAGELVTKDQLIARAWPNRVVEDSNLRVQVAILRKALDDGADGNGYVAAVPGRGYRFVATTAHMDARHASIGAGERTNNLPTRLNPVIGRADVVDILVSRLHRQRLVTVVGTGGIGKTTVVVAAATGLLATYRDGVWLVDLAPLADAALLPGALAAAIGVALTSHHPVDELVGALRDKHALLILDNCERLVEAAAVLAEAILKGAPSTTILATSREPLRAEGESVHRLSPLKTPPAAAGLTAASALRFSAVELFVERVASSMDGFGLDDDDAPIAADICCQLDGIALAIELAAARVGVFGIRGVAERLGDCFRVLVGGRRTALPRHQTLVATLDWSHALLADEQRAVFRRLGAFAGGFTLESACRVAADDRIPGEDVPDILAELVEKSLVAVATDAPVVRYRLLDTTRAYACAKLSESAEFAEVQRRHAECFNDLFARSLTEWQTRACGEWLGCYRSEVDNVRLALDWAFSPAGDVAVGISLTVAAIPLWFQLSSTDECRQRVGRALAEAGVASGALYARQIMQLYAALGLSQTFTIGLVPQASAAWAKALDIAENLVDREFQLEALWGLWFCRIGLGEYRLALGTAREFRRRADSPSDLALGDRLIGVPLHVLGRGAKARSHIERSLSQEPAPARSADSIRFRFNQPLAARAMLAQMLWLEGLPEQAMEEARHCVQGAREGGHAISLCDALAQAACPLAMFTGEWSMAEEAVAELLDEADRHALAPWKVLGQCWGDALKLRRGELDPGLSLLAGRLNELRQVRFAFSHAGFMGALAEGLVSAGQPAHGLRTIDEALRLCVQRKELWCVAELLRIKGEILQHGASPQPAQAEELFVRSLEHARRQRALSWELRTVTSLARLRCLQGRREEARDVLATTYGRFSEGFATGDLKAAKALIDALS
jgi:predicted ATPase/DNA-binding winged helix-turn-helix (wHTH) protein